MYLKLLPEALNLASLCEWPYINSVFYARVWLDLIIQDVHSWKTIDTLLHNPTQRFFKICELFYIL